MNDWLDYKGSGSARAYAANGLMSDSNISHGLFGIQTKKDKKFADRKQMEANDRYIEAQKDQMNKLKAEAEAAKKKYEDSIDNYNHWVKEYEAKSNELRSLESDRKKVAAKSPLTAYEVYAERIKRATDDKNHAKDAMETCQKRMRELKVLWVEAEDKHTDFCVNYIKKPLP